MTLDDFLRRAFSARSMSTLYWLSKGGWLRAEERTASARTQPGRSIDAAHEFEHMRRQRPQVHAAYVDGLEKSGLALASLPPLACDCSGFVCWALGVARDSAPWAQGWFDTNSIHADALGAGRAFTLAVRAQPGMLVVYPKPPSRGTDGPPGHIGIVTEVDAAGEATRVLHCAPENYLLPPPAGLPNNAIAETGPQQFQADARSRYVAWRGFEADPTPGP